MASNISINTQGLGINWQLGETYRVAIDQGFVQQPAGLKLPIAANSSVTSFSTPGTRPKPGAQSVPTNGSIAEKGIQDIQIKIDRNANLTTLGGNIYLWKDAATDVLIKTHLVTSGNVTSGNVVTINVVGALEANVPYYITSNANIFMDGDGFKNNAYISSDYTFTAPPAPLLISTVPTNNGKMAAGQSNVSLTFDRTITANSGNLYVYTASGNTLVKTISIGQTNISNANVSIGLIGNISANVSYYVKTDANIIHDATLIKYPGISSSNIFVFEAPGAPILTSTTPTNYTRLAVGATSASLTFDRTVTADTGNIYLFNANSASLVGTYPVSSNATIQNANVSIDLYNKLSANVEYYITSNANIVQDSLLLKYPGLSSNSDFRFYAPVAPVITGVSPSLGSNGTLGYSTATITFDRNMYANVGNIVLKRAWDSQIIESYDITGPNVTISGANISANVFGRLDASTEYFIVAENNVAKDYVGCNFGGFGASDIFYWTTAPALSIVSLYPTNGSTNIYENANVSVTLNRGALPNSGNIYLYTSANTLIQNYSIGSTSFTGNTVTLNVAGKLSANVSYYVKTDANVAQDSTGIKWPGIANSSVWSFTTSPSFSRDFRYPTPEIFVNGSTVTQYTPVNLITATDYSANVYTLQVRNLGDIANITTTSTMGGTLSLPTIDIPSTIPNGYRGGHGSPLLGGTLSGGSALTAGAGGGGGGAGSAGSNARSTGTTIVAGSPGNGIVSNITGTVTAFGGGGGGGSVASNYNGSTPLYPSNATYGTHDATVWGGGNGSGSGDGENGVNGLGGGGGGAGNGGQYSISTGLQVRIGGSGGSGRVILRYNNFLNNVTSTGGNVSTVDGHTIHDFTSGGNFTISGTTTPVVVEYLVVGGGGAGGSTGQAAWGGGGGGGGGTVKRGFIELSPKTYTIEVGIGGAPSGFTTNGTNTGGNPGGQSGIYDGDDSAVIIAKGGGGGGGSGLANWGGGIDGTGGGGGGFNGNESFHGAAALAETHQYPTAYANCIITGNAIQINDILEKSTISFLSTRQSFPTGYNTDQLTYIVKNPNNEITTTNQYIGISGTPAAPIISNIVATSNTSVTVTFIPSSTSGNANISSYTIYAGNYSNTISSFGSGTFDLTNLDSGAYYDFRLYATNIVGNSIPSSAYPITMPGVDLADPYFNYVELLIPGGGTHGSTTIVDESSNSLSLRQSTNVTYSNTVTKYAATSLYFSGTAYLGYTGIEALQPREDFTWEAWVYPTSLNGYPTIIGYGANGALLLYHNTGGSVKIEMDKDGTGLDINYSTGESFTTNTWQHMAVCRSGNNLRVFKNGTQIGSTQTLSGNITQTDNLAIGSYVDDLSGGNRFAGYMEQIRFTKGIARYTSAFTPPTEGF